MSLAADRPFETDRGHGARTGLLNNRRPRPFRGRLGSFPQPRAFPARDGGPFDRRCWQWPRARYRSGRFDSRFQPPDTARYAEAGSSAVGAEFHSSPSNAAEFCRSTRKWAAICLSRAAPARAGPPSGTTSPRRRSARRTSCRAAIRPHSMPAAPTSRAGRTC